MPAPSPVDVLSEELGAVAGRIEREARLRIDAALADIKRIDAERELRLDRLEREFKERIGSLKDGEPGQPGTSITVDDVVPVIAAEIERQVLALPKPENGKSITVDDVRPVLEELVATIPPGEPGKSVTIDDVRPMILEAVAALPKPADGKSITVDDVMPVLQGMVAELPVPEPGAKGDKGDPGPAGSLSEIAEWTDRVHYEGEIRTHEGSTFQAIRDTAKSPPHDDWRCIASAGRSGEDGRSIDVIGTFDPTKQDYRKNNVVALNGASFCSKRDNPGACPGEDWQLIASQGKRGQPGEKGERGLKGDKGDPGPGVAGLSISDQGLMTLVNGDGSFVELDLYPVLSKLG